MRRSILVAAAASVALVLGACGSDAGETPTNEPTTDAAEATDEAEETDDAPDPSGASLKIWVDENREAAVAAAVADFKAATGTDVTVEVKNFEDIRADFIAQVPTGEGPDITVGAHDWLGEFVSNGVVAPVEFGDRAGEFNENAINAFNWEGQIYGMPYGIESIALIRNLELAPEAPATFDEMVEMGTEIGTDFPFVLQVGDEGDPYHMYPFQTAFGAPVFKSADDGSYTSELGMGGEEGHAFAEWLSEQGAAGTLDTAVSGDIAKQQFIDGNAPFIISGPWLIQDITGFDVAVSEIPSPGSNPAAPFAGVHGFYVSAQSQNALVANDFLLNYIGTQEVQTALYEAGNRIPALTASADAITGDPVAEGFVEAAATAQPMPSIPEMGSVWAFWGVTEAQIIDGAEPIAAWDKMVSDIEAAIGQ